jgi:two-component system nitrogen regulation sensor histidine kinase NtrY
MERIAGLADVVEGSAGKHDYLQRIGRSALPLVLLTLVLTAGATYWLIGRSPDKQSLLSAGTVALLLVMNLVPAIALLVLVGQWIARRRAARSLVGGDGRLHVRLVAIFSVTASLPLMLVVIFASLLFQYGVEFWFSANKRGMLENAMNLARGYYEQNLRELGDETATMAGDLRDYLSEAPITSPAFSEGYIYQVVTRKLNRSSIIEIGKDGVARTPASARRPMS